MLRPKMKALSEKGADRVQLWSSMKSEHLQKKQYCTRARTDQQRKQSPFQRRKSRLGDQMMDRVLQSASKLNPRRNWPQFQRFLHLHLQKETSSFKSTSRKAKEARAILTILRKRSMSEPLAKTKFMKRRNMKGPSCHNRSNRSNPKFK